MQCRLHIPNQQTLDLIMINLLIAAKTHYATNRTVRLHIIDYLKLTLKFFSIGDR